MNKNTEELIKEMLKEYPDLGCDFVKDFTKKLLETCGEMKFDKPEDRN